MKSNGRRRWLSNRRSRFLFCRRRRWLLILAGRGHGSRRIHWIICFPKYLSIEKRWCMGSWELLDHVRATFLLELELSEKMVTFWRTRTTKSHSHSHLTHSTKNASVVCPSTVRDCLSFGWKSRLNETIPSVICILSHMTVLVGCCYGSHNDDL